MYRRGVNLATNGGGSDYDWNTRLQRAFTQRIYLIDVTRANANVADAEADTDVFLFKVMGSSDSQYDVAINNENVISCSCPDHRTRGKLCKHMLFVLIRALGISNDTVFREHFETNRFTVSPDTIEKAGHYLERRAQGLVNANFAPNPILPEPTAPRYSTAPPPVPKVVAAPAPPKTVPRKDYLEDMCPICCEDFKETQSEPTVWCQLSCGNSVHQSCFQKWNQATHSRLLKQATCVHCRSKWL